MTNRSWATRFGLVLILVSGLTFLAYFPSCSRGNAGAKNAPNVIRVSIKPEPVLEKKPAGPNLAEVLDWQATVSSGVNRVVLMAVGDIMMHDSNFMYAYHPETGQYDFLPYFEYLTPIFKQADWVMGNLETKLAGKEARYTGYPLFNAPEKLADDLKKAGFTLVSTANNHALDRFKAGVINTNQNLDRSGLLNTGSFVSRLDRDTVRILSKNNIRLAVLAYSYDTNGIPLPKGEDYLVNLINLDLIAQDIQAAKRAAADFIVCLMHWGWEYHRVPNDQQKSLAEKMMALGADVILGSHPHVVQPYKISSGPEGQKMVIYSLGNFIAHQFYKFTDLGVILKLNLTKDPARNKRLIEVEAIPTKILCLYKNNRRTFRVLPIKDALDQRPKYDLPAPLFAELEQQYLLMTKHLQSMSAQPAPATVTTAGANLNVR
ncbi:MAG: CapA family protein [Thermodesulfobacteriota bacterium]